MRKLLTLFAGLVLASTGLLYPAEASARPKGPIALDCEALPCSAVLPGATRFEVSQDGSHAEGYDEAGDLLGWLALSTDFVDVKAYSGKPMETLVGLTKEGMIGGAVVVRHSEPILLVGIPEQALSDFVGFYAGKSPLQRIVVGRANREDALSVDAISGATVTVLAQNQTVLETARALGARVGVFEVGQLARGHFVSDAEPWSWGQMLERGALERLVVSETQMGMSESAEPALDLYFGIVDAPHIGKPLLGQREYTYRFERLEEGEHLLVMLNRGHYSFKGSAFVRGGIFDRVRIQQDLREITFRDTDYWNLPDVYAEGSPEFNEGALFAVRGGRFDPGAPYELVFLGSQYNRKGAFSREFHEFTRVHQLPESIYVVDEVAGGIPWRQAWANQPLEIAVLLLYLCYVVGVFVARRKTTADRSLIRRLHLASMVFGFVVVGVWMGAQPSVTQIFTAVGSAVGEWRWELFLSEPAIFILWIFIFGVSLYWGRGVFCGWVCPYGAMTELAFKLSERLGIRTYELPDSIHLKLRHLRYGILAVLVGVFLYDSILAEQLAEVEPFKSTFLVPAWTRHWGFLAWWLVLLAISFAMYRPFCRYLCPLGGGLALLSSFRPSGPRRRAFCSQCTICTRGCEPRAIRPDGTIDARECLSCMDCEATYRAHDVCPPLVAMGRLKLSAELSAAQQQKLATLQEQARDV